MEKELPVQFGVSTRRITSAIGMCNGSCGSGKGCSRDCAKRVQSAIDQLGITEPPLSDFHMRLLRTRLGLQPPVDDVNPEDGIDPDPASFGLGKLTDCSNDEL